MIKRVVLVLLVGCLLGTVSVLAQDDGIEDPDPFETEIIDPAEFDESEFDAAEFDEPPVDQQVPDAVPDAPPAAVDVNLELLIGARLDVETLAGLTLGAQRPDGWSGNTNSADPDLAITIRLDLETLASFIAAERPAGWFGVVNSSRYAIARDIRHDLELLADFVDLAPRPANWVGGPALLRCDRATQALIRLLEESAGFTLQADRTAPNFCTLAAREASTFAEVLLDGGAGVGEVAVAGSGEPRITGADVVGYLNLAGTIRGGVFPDGERLELVARQSGDNATLMLVRGVGFEMFVDYRQTNVSQADFLSLRNVAAISVAPRCTASWCG